MSNFCRKRPPFERSDLGADADDHARHGLVVGHAVDQRALLERVVHERAHAAEDRRVDAEPERAVAFRGRHQDRLRRHRAAAVVRVVIAEAEEDEEVVVGFVRLDVFDQRGTGRSFRLEPGELIAERMRFGEDLLRPFRELDRIALDRNGKAVHRDAVNDLAARWKFVLPRNVVAMRARGQHLDLDVPGEVLGNIPRMLLGAAVDVGAVPLNDDRDFHCRSSSESGALGASGA